MKRIFYFLLLVLVLSFVIPKGLSAAEEELYIPHSFTAYEKPSFTSKEVAQYSSTSVRIIDKQGSYWYKVYTSKGEKWVYYNPNLKNKTIDYRFNAFKGPSFNSTRVSSFSPTTVTVIGKHEDWYQIQTGSLVMCGCMTVD
ncbi:hypothetical protein [Gracilibacillus sp. JCM 18860]|uniref:hypothetical protein n=1 Tax=Gracilibacillus sp. JCM 18860 TaxID=1306159 RepID=UPI0006D11430